MKIIYFIIVLIHGLIHLLGFIKAFGFKEVKELSLNISKPFGLIWLIATLLLVLYSLLYISNNKYSYIIGFIGLLISQILILYFWKDAKFGTLANIIIFLVSLSSYSQLKFIDLIEKEKKSMIIKSEKADIDIFFESNIKNLPKPIKKWLLNSGALGKPKITNAKILQNALMKMKPEQEDWYQASATQYSIINEPSFIWTVNLSMNKFISISGRDKFENGKGEMLIKLNSFINIVNEKGSKIDEGIIQRFLGEMVWMPSLAISPYIIWEEIDDLTAKAKMKYKNTEGEGTFYFNEKGDFIKFIALRFQGNEKDSTRKEWILTVEEYKNFEGIKIPSKMKATWKLDDKEWNWLKLEIVDIKYNISN